MLLCEISQKSADLFSVILRQFPAPGNLSPVLPIGAAPDAVPPSKTAPAFVEQALWESGFGDVLDVDDALTRVDPGAPHLTGDGIVAHGGVEGQHHATLEQQLLRLARVRTACSPVSAAA